MFNHPALLAASPRGAIGFVIYSTDKARNDWVLISAVFGQPFGRQGLRMDN
jgi:hypothetical protein